jgi:DNA-binding CsgD family transcriptional regulator
MSEHRRGGVPTGTSLSLQGLPIAELAAGGLTHRQIGQKFSLSHRTVGSHLYRIFPKPGITTRSQLRDALIPADRRAQRPAW